MPGKSNADGAGSLGLGAMSRRVCSCATPGAWLCDACDTAAVTIPDLRVACTDS